MAGLKKIVFVISSLSSGGAERVVSTLANTMAARGYEVSIVLIVNRTQCYELDPGIQLYYMDSEQDTQKNSALRVISRLVQLRKLLKSLCPDAIISFMAETNIDVCLSLLGLKTPVIVSERNDPKLDPPGKMKQILRRFAYLRANGFVFQTPDAQAFFSERIQRRSRIILNPLMAAIPEPFRGERQKRIVSVARLNAQKNYPLMLKAFCGFSQKHPEYVLEIYGQGSLEAQLQQQAQKLGLTEKVVFKGFCAQVHTAIREAGFFVMSSDFEGMPNALIEAMALGLPCISTDCPCGGPRVLIQNGENGILVPVGDAAALENAMCTLAADPDYAAKIGRAAELLRSRVDIHAITDQWIDYMNTVIRN